MRQEPGYRKQMEVFEADAAQARLVEMGLDGQSLREVVLRGEYARADATAYDPATSAGTRAYEARVRALREIYIPQGWQLKREGGLELTASPDGARAIITRSGDDAVGDPNGDPRPTQTVGETTSKAARNNAQLWIPALLLDVARDTPQAVPEARETWMLLVNRRGDLVRAELSLPAATKDGEAFTWIERIMLPEVDLNDPNGDERQAADAASDEAVHDVPIVKR